MPTINDSIREGQKGGVISGQSQASSSNSVVAGVAKASGVAEADVAKVLNALGLERGWSNAVKLNNGQEPLAANTRIAVRLGRTLVVF
jgi:hypothetical protein